MEFFDVVERRRSVRVFTDQPVEKEKLDRILQACRDAPSAGNRQAYEIYVVTDAARRGDLARAAYEQAFLAQAPLALVFCTHAGLSAERYGERGENLYALQDASIACTFAMLAATAQGLASVWVGAYDDDRVWRILGEPPGQVPVAVLPLGYPAETPARRPRRQLEELAHYL
jgi:nitroreductase